MPRRHSPGRSEADRADWIEDQTIVADEETGGPWTRAYAAHTHRDAHWPDSPGYDRRLHNVDGHEPEPTTHKGADDA